MAKNKVKLIREFYGGIVTDDKSKIRGAAQNVEEIDIFSNSDFMQAEQIMTTDSMPASTEVYAYTADEDDIVWGYGKETSGNKVRLVKVTTGGADNPGAFATQFTSADATDLAYTKSPVVYLRRDDGDFLYYVTNASGTVRLKSYSISGDSESEQDSASTAMTLSDLDGTHDKISMRVIFGTLYVTNGKYISSVDKDGVFTEAAFTLPNGWESVDIVGVSDIAIILARNVNRLENQCKAFWWDLTAALYFDDHFDVPMGGPQWIYKFKERIVICCAQNGVMKFFNLSGAFPGAVPLSLLELDNMSTETSTQDISPAKSVQTKDRILYFTVWRADKAGIYAVGQRDESKPLGIILSKRFDTSDYSNHTPYDLHIQGPNYYAAFDDNGTADHTRCESQNSPTRSSNAVFQTIWLDDDDPTVDKTIKSCFVTTYPLAASTAVAMKIATDYGALASITRGDASTMNGTGDVIGHFEGKISNKKTWSVELTLTSSTTNSPKVTGLGFDIVVDEKPASK